MAFQSNRSENVLKSNLVINHDTMRTTSDCDDELVTEPDEPPEQKRLTRTSSKNGFKKHVVAKMSKGESLLTMAILSDSDSAATADCHGVPKRGFSTASTMSTGSLPSVAELTSDGGFTSPSRTNSPSPPLPRTLAFQLPRPAVPKQALVAIKGHDEDASEERNAELQKADHDAVVAALGRKRCISFACNNSQPKSKPKEAAQPPKPEPEIIAPVARKCLLKFACDQKPEKLKHAKLQSPPPPQPRTPSHRRSNNHVDEKGLRSPQAAHHKFHEFASSVGPEAESWMHAPKRNTGLMKVDCLLEKERNIQKLSREVDDEVALEEELEDEEDDLDVSDGGYEEDDEEEDDDYEAWTDSDEDNNEGDNDDDGEDDDEEDDNEDDDDDDEDVDEVDGLFVQNPFTYSEIENRPLSTRTSSESSLASHLANKVGPAIPHPSARSMTPELPDSTDFVPGTFDEDKALEDAYKSCMEQRKAAKKIITPQDIDPSFPTSEPEDEDDEEAGSGKGGCEMWMKKSSRGRRSPTRSRKNSTSESVQNSPRRHYSPAPIRRKTNQSTRALSPAPMSHRPSNVDATPVAARNVSQNRIQFDFASKRPMIPRTKSLPRPGFHSGFRKRSTQGVTIATSPKQAKIPIRPRGAIDIVKGLEKKRMRRQERANAKNMKKEWKAEAGEGVEKMRELGLLNKERNAGCKEAPGAKWVISI